LRGVRQAGDLQQEESPYVVEVNSSIAYREVMTSDVTLQTFTIEEMTNLLDRFSHPKNRYPSFLKA